LRFGVLGCADIAERRTIPGLLEQPLTELVAVASRTSARAESFAAKFGCEPVTGYENLLARNDIDAVYIPLPAGLHAAWAMRALAAGKHVFCEKPLATTHAEALEAVEFARARGLLLMENFMFLHHSQHAAVRELIADGAIGEVRSFTGEFGFPTDPVAGTAGVLLEVGVHPIRAARLFLGDELDVAGAQVKTDPDSGLDVAGAALLRAPSGATAHLSYGYGRFYRCTYAIWGSEGRLSLHRAFTPPDTHSPTVRLERQDGVKELTLAPDRQFANVAGVFARTVLEARDFAPHFEDVLRQAALVDAIRAAQPAG
jgi:predicted dehydrogenase